MWGRGPVASSAARVPAGGTALCRSPLGPWPALGFCGRLAPVSAAAASARRCRMRVSAVTLPAVVSAASGHRQIGLRVLRCRGGQARVMRE